MQRGQHTATESNVLLYLTDFVHTYFQTKWPEIPHFAVLKVKCLINKNFNLFQTKRNAKSDSGARENPRLRRIREPPRREEPFNFPQISKVSEEGAWAAPASWERLPMPPQQPPVQSQPCGANQDRLTVCAVIGLLCPQSGNRPAGQCYCPILNNLYYLVPSFFVNLHHRPSLILAKAEFSHGATSRSVLITRKIYSLWKNIIS